MTELTCESCKHWHKIAATGMTLGQGERGECRRAVPQVVPVPGPGGSFGVLSQYPTHGPGFFACGEYEKREGP